MDTDSTDNPGHGGRFKRQVVFRISAEEWPLLETAAREHGSIQAAILASLRALTHTSLPAPDRDTPEPPAKAPAATSAPAADEELTAREAATLLGVKPSTVRGYIRSRRIAGRYDDRRGWLTTRAAVNTYRNR